MLRKGVVLTPDDFIGVDWLAKFKEIGLNTLGLHSGGGPGHNVLEHLGNCASTEFHEKVKAAGIDYEYELHAPHDLLPRDVFNTHPEFFIQPMGPKKERVTTGNWCGGTKAALDTIAANGATLGMKLNPSTHRHFFWGEDLNDGWCHCDKCAQYSPSDQNLRTANAIAAKLEETDPEAVAETLSRCVVDANIPAMLVTLGSDGAVWADREGRCGVCPPQQVPVADTTGVGDAFFAGVAAGLTYGKDLQEACVIGTRLASSVICSLENTCPRFLPSEFGLILPKEYS